MQSFELDKSDLLKIKRALEEDDTTLKALISEYHPSEIAILFESLSQESRERIIHFHRSNHYFRTCLYSSY